MITRTLAETAQAGWDDGADDAPLTETELTEMVALHGPYLRVTDDAA